MNEINFFEEDKIRQEFQFEFKYLKYLPIFLSLGFIVLLLCLNKVLDYNIQDLSIQVSELENQKYTLMQPVENNSVDTEMADETILELKRKSVEVIENIKAYEKVTQLLLEDLKNAIPESVFLNDLSINNGEITITGYSLTGNNIARFQNNLENIYSIYDVFVYDIVNDYGNYSFSLSAKVRS